MRYLAGLGTLLVFEDSFCRVTGQATASEEPGRRTGRSASSEWGLAMAGARSALIVATYQYADPRLRMLKAPEQDAEALGDVLGDPDIGGFDVRTVINQPAHVISVELAEFFGHRHSDDVLLVHFSCHGVKDDSGELFLAAADTRMDLLEATAVASAFVNKSMTRSRSGCVVLLLDCCYAGAFARGMTRAGSDVDLTDRFGGRGRAVITASTALQLAFEGDDLTASDPEATGPSVFTRALVDGLRTGEADRDADGIVSLDELYGYVHDEVTRVNPDQTPQKWLFDVAGDLYVARRSTPVTRPSALPAPLVESMESLLAWERESTIEPLTTLLRGEHPGRSLAARLALQQLADNDDSMKVRQAASAALATAVSGAPSDTVPEETAPEPVEPLPHLEEPVSPTRAESVQASVDAEPRAVIPDAAQGETDAHRVATPWWRRRSLAIATAAAVVLLLVAGGLVARLVTSGGGGGGGSDSTSGGASPPTLGPRTMVAASTANHTLRLLDVGPDGSQVVTNTLLHTSSPASGATVSVDRQWITYQQWPGGKSNTSQTRILRADGSGERPLLDNAAAKKCPTSRRPAWSPDSTQVALVCADQSGAVLGLFVYDRNEHTLVPVVAAPTLCCGVTWTDSTLIFGMRSSPDVATRLWYVSSSGGDRKALPAPQPGESYLEPDATQDGRVTLIAAKIGLDSGRLELAGPDESSQAAPRILVPEGAGHPSWSPDGTQIVYVSGSTPGHTSLRVFDISSGQSSAPLSGGSFDAPAWGSR